jgi:hypothetical protein
MCFPSDEAQRKKEIGMTTEFRFEHARPFMVPLLIWGVTPQGGTVTVDGEVLRVRFGFVTLETSLDNVERAEVTGPYRWWRAVGVRLSLADHGITFGTTASGGVCLTLREPVSVRVGPVPVPLRHPGVTVTVADPAGLLRALGQ